VSPTPTTTAAWTKVAEQPDVQAVQFRDVAWTGTRFVAVATARAGGGAFLDSADGLAWHLQRDVAPAGFPERLASGPAGIVAVGKDADGRAVRWFSSDGLSWSDAGAAFGKGSGDDTIAVTDVVATDSGWLAVGREDPECNLNCGLEPVRALVWTSTDGLAWIRLADRPAFKGAAMLSVVRTGSGVVAVGSSGLAAAAWTSADGAAWTRSADAPALHTILSAEGDGAVQMASVAYANGVAAAVGTEFPMRGNAPPTGRAWWSTDGAAWVEAIGQAFAEGQLFTIAGTPSGFLGSGTGSPDCRGGLWTSANGRSWTCTTAAPGYAGMTPYAAASSPTVEIVVGFDSSIESDTGFPGGVWWRPIS
jgi:hypothetical protein